MWKEAAGAPLGSTKPWAALTHIITRLLGLNILPLLLPCAFTIFHGLRIILIFFVFIYFWFHWVFVAAHGLSLVVAGRGYSLVVVCGPFTAVASLVAEHGV